MKKNQKEIEKEKQQDEKEEKETSRKEGVEKRKRAKKIDKQARWSGLILLVIIMLAGFLMWVTGEVKKNTGSEVVPIVEPSVQIQEEGTMEKVIIR
ncbi:MAG: hypothetical protein ABII80_01625 [bacterium]